MSTADQPERGQAALPGPAPRILVIQAPYYADVVGGMLKGARETLAPLNAEVEVVDVAGAFELPAALRMALKSGRKHDGYLLLGCVVKGETDHYDFICDAVCQGVMNVSAETGVPLGFGLLTVENLEQALARSADDRHNKGGESAHALVRQIAIAREWGVTS
ncbi:6,7-dimethyl-8-ribityllumazine synthase [Acetobacteraceae bacterium H6797]|nr:6,7-dimethyl-8-ribityllumazine synthase [Acetobacteraceae bacterium H6797]